MSCAPRCACFVLIVPPRNAPYRRSRAALRTVVGNRRITAITLPAAILREPLPPSRPHPAGQVRRVEHAPRELRRAEHGGTGGVDPHSAERRREHDEVPLLPGLVREL